MTYNATYDSGDVADASVNFIATGFVLLSELAVLVTMAVLLVIGVRAWKKR